MAGFFLSSELQRIRRFIGLPAQAQHSSEQVVSSLGGLIGIALVMLMTQMLLGSSVAVLIIPSMGATAVLVFAIPHSVFAQPWSVIVGNVSSAVVGVACYRLIPNVTFAAAIAVGLAIGVMHLTRSMHPPGGATALLAVTGGSAIHDLGFYYALYPTAINCMILLMSGIAFNAFFAWRRYPVSLMRYAQQPRKPSEVQINETHVASAIEQLNVLVDASPQEIAEIMRHTLKLAERSRDELLPTVYIGRFYCNDKPGQQWSVRQIIDERRSDNPAHDLVIYKVVDGSGLHQTGSCTRIEFARWVGSELQARQKQEK